MTVKVYAPASIGNVSVGFDVLGMAVTPLSGELLGDVVSIEASATGENQLEVVGDFADKLPTNYQDNIVYHCLQLFENTLADVGKQASPVAMQLNKSMPVGSGLGSSACSVVAALVALNEYYQKPFDDSKLLTMMGQMEAQISGSLHYDNVAPCFLGGLQLMVSDDRVITRTLPELADIYWVMAYPGIEVSTRASREVLPLQYSRQTLIQYGQNLASFIDACHRQDNKQALSYINDVVAEPYRLELIPRCQQAKQYVLENGAAAAGISGSGPTLFVACEDLSKAQQLAQYLTDNYLQSDAGFVHICLADQQGARVI
ncbi:homoserine kinase [Thalassotalea sp. Y01]|uniref:homoserine kinase n=1 Tax=Thalassotalea sp. Y01 TaxID=2729613 RepID=UPI00145E8863|nr:homoserine kinase [Thalassotalea sp. Y01]NMP15235.1 homoserine kinase [Thalassotalea sp. Y01]